MDTEDIIKAINDFGIYTDDGKYSNILIDEAYIIHKGKKFLCVNKHNLKSRVRFTSVAKILNNEKLVNIMYDKFADYWKLGPKARSYVFEGTVANLSHINETLVSILYDQIYKNDNDYSDTITGIPNILKSLQKQETFAKPLEEIHAKPLEEIHAKPLEEIHVKPLEKIPSEPLEKIPSEPLKEIPSEPLEEPSVKPYKKITLLMRRRVWDLFIGESVGKTMCPCCKMDYIIQLTFKCGLIVSTKNGGKQTLDNLHPMCKSCYTHMGDDDMHVFMQDYQFNLK